MSIRLICSDIDGTLLQYGKKELEGEIFEQIRALHQRGIWFCPASGRQYTSLRKLFAPVADCCVLSAKTAAPSLKKNSASPKIPCRGRWQRKLPTICGPAARGRAR